VTLELGGKAPAIVCDDFPLRTAAERLMFVKCLNAGQICTTIDYLFLPKGKTAAFTAMAKEIVEARYPSIASADLTSIIDERSFNRLTAALEDAQAKGATLVQLIPGKPWDAATRKIAPHIVLNAPEDSILRQREIFGPILPIIEYSQLNETIQYINDRPRPLAIYPFSNDNTTIQTLLDRVMSGGVSVNDALFHVGQTDLPFGGVGESGMGHYHGHEGFNTFSKLRPVFYQAPFSAVKFLWPPYGKFATKYLNFLSK
jgi:coniferyl-aldehyde dehydrogenase